MAESVSLTAQLTKSELILVPKNMFPQRTPNNSTFIQFKSNNSNNPAANLNSSPNQKKLNAGSSLWGDMQPQLDLTFHFLKNFLIFSKLQLWTVLASELLEGPTFCVKIPKTASIFLFFRLKPG